jgi:hypothetical protein
MEGIVVGCDANQEWLLSWWWGHYSKTNSYPVLFVDFGMTAEGIAYCQQRGTCVSLREAPFVEKQIRSLKKRTLWEQHYSAALWRCREVWFKKPFALLCSPFDLSLWLDLDCQVQKPLEPLFNCLSFGIDLALCPEPEAVQELHRKKGFIRHDEINYNCGVIAFRKRAEVLVSWTKEIKLHNDQYPAEQQVLSRVLKRDQTPFIELPIEFNWGRERGPNEHAYIQHFHGGVLKSLIKNSPQEDCM